MKFLPLLVLLYMATPFAQAENLPAPISAAEALGARVVGTFDAPGGLKGYAARYGGQGVALYLTPDGEHVLIGSLLDAKGNDLSKAPLDRMVYQPLGKEIWQRLEKSDWIADGDAHAPRTLYVFSDANCPYCNMFWNQARPWVKAGRVQIRHVMVGIIRPDSAGKAAALLAARDRSQALAEHEKAGRSSTLRALEEIPDHVQRQLDSNMALMREMSVSATPAIFYMDEAGRLQQQNGAPRLEVLEAIMGSSKPAAADR